MAFRIITIAFIIFLTLYTYRDIFKNRDKNESTGHFVSYGIMGAVVMKVNAFGPFGMMGDATGLSGGKLIIGIVINFILGALMCCGVGLYAPCMALCALLGMNLNVAFPIMMGSCAFLMPVNSMEFIKAGRYNRNAALIAIPTGLIGVWIAYAIVKTMPIYALTLIVAGVLIYMSISFIISIRNSKNSIGG